MHNKIINYLKDIEIQNEIKILLACETGSRAWGFESLDSDYDVRIIYQHHKDWYLNLDRKKDSLEFMFENNDIDITGWDLRKCLELLQKSNPPLLERIQSPIIYHVDAEFLTNFKQLAAKAYSKIATAYHYMSMAKKLMLDVQDKDEYKLKRFFYVLRASVACLWIEQMQQMPPIDFHIMLKKLDIKSHLLNRIYELIELKSTVDETYLHTGEKALIAFMQNLISTCQENFKSFKHAKVDIEEYNQLFINQLNK